MRGDLGKRLNLHCHGETGPVYSFLTLSKNPCCLNHAESVSVNWSNCLLTFLIPRSPPAAPEPTLINLRVPPSVAGYISNVTLWCWAIAPSRILAPLLPFSAFPFVGPSHWIVNPLDVNAWSARFWIFSTDPFTAMSAYLAKLPSQPNMEASCRE